MGNKKGTTFILLRPDKTILMQLRDGNSPLYPHRWCFPGGAPNQDEDVLDTVVREANEEFELTLDRTECKLINTHPSIYDTSELQYVYVCKVNQEQKPVLHEGAAMKWMNIDEIKSLALGFGQEVFIGQLEEFLRNRQEL